MTGDETGYNGYKNYETWAVKLWLDNDEGSYRYMQGRASEVLEEHTDEDGTDEDGFKYDFSAWLKEYHEEQAEELNIPASVWSDLLNAALSEVDWYELAEMYLDEAKEES